MFSKAVPLASRLDILFVFIYYVGCGLDCYIYKDNGCFIYLNIFTLVICLSYIVFISKLY